MLIYGIGLSYTIVVSWGPCVLWSPFYHHTHFDSLLMWTVVEAVMLSVLLGVLRSTVIGVGSLNFLSPKGGG